MYTLSGPTIHGMISNILKDSTKASHERLAGAISYLTSVYGNPEPSMGTDILAEVDAIKIANTVEEVQQLMATMRGKCIELGELPSCQHEFSKVSVTRFYNKLGNSWISAKERIFENIQMNPVGFTLEDAFKLVMEKMKFAVSDKESVRDIPKASVGGITKNNNSYTFAEREAY